MSKIAKTTHSRSMLLALPLLLAACGAARGPDASSPASPPPSGPPAPMPAPIVAQTSAPTVGAVGGGTPATAPRAAVSAPIHPEAVEAATGAKPESAGDVVKASFPRSDLPIEVDGWKMPPFMGLTSWAGFSPGKPGVEAMLMGDLVLFEDEVNPVMSVLFEAGVEVTALHNHFFYTKPPVYFMHIGGEGPVATLGRGVRLAVEKVKELRKKSPKPAERSAGAPLPAKNAIDGEKLDAIFGMKGARKDGMYKATMGRQATASCGCAVGKAMGVNTWAGFAGTDDNAAVDGDFAVTEGELQPVLRALRAGEIDIVAIHHHMTGESPRILFLHYWGRGRATELADTIKKAVDLTAWDGKAKST